MAEHLTLDMIETALDMHGYKHKRSGGTILSQCPRHDGGDLNCQVDSNGYCFCYSHCQGYWLDEVFEELKDEKYKKGEPMTKEKLDKFDEDPKRKEVKKYVIRDYKNVWEKLPKISTKLTEPLKGVLPLSTLDDLGWRWIENGPYGLGTGVFIPYWGGDFDVSHEESVYPERLPFCQVRHLDGPIRFNFPKDAEPKLYGSWMLSMAKEDNLPIFLCEGTSDWVTLWEVCVPAVALPSSSATDMLTRVAQWCEDNGVAIVYAGDNDNAGDKLRQALDDGSFSYKMCQPPSKYNDWTDFLIAEGAEAVLEVVKPFTSLADSPEPPKTGVDAVLEVFPDAVQLELK